MLCCLLIALFGGPLVLWTGPEIAMGSDCCTGSRRSILALSAIILGTLTLCLAMSLLARFQPAPLGHICSFLARS